MRHGGVLASSGSTSCRSTWIRADPERASGNRRFQSTVGVPPIVGGAQLETTRNSLSTRFQLPSNALMQTGVSCRRGKRAQETNNEHPERPEQKIREARLH